MLQTHLAISVVKFRSKLINDPIRSDPIRVSAIPRFGSDFSSPAATVLVFASGEWGMAII